MILDNIRHWHFTVEKGGGIYDSGDATGTFFRVDKGCIRLQFLSEDGERRILAFCLPGDIFGLEIGGAHTEGAEAVENSQVSRFSTSAILEPPVDASRVEGILGAASGMISSLFTQLDGLGRGSAEDRLTWFLHWLAGRQDTAGASGRVRLPMNRQDIADFLGMAPETLSRTFAKLKARGIIEFGQNKTIRLVTLGDSAAVTVPLVAARAGEGWF